MVELLIENGGDVSTANHYNDTALIMAIKHGMKTGRIFMENEALNVFFFFFFRV